MGVFRAATFQIATLGSVAFLPVDVDAQTRDSASSRKGKDSLAIAVAGQHYSADELKRTLLGSGWREVWTTPVAVSPLDLATYADGLKVLERGGGYQSITLHLQEESGWKEYRFRTVNKFPVMTLPSPLRETAVGRIIQDEVSSLFAGAALMVPPFLDAITA